jgi:hypothetical protein
MDSSGWGRWRGGGWNFWSGGNHRELSEGIELADRASSNCVALCLSYPRTTNLGQTPTGTDLYYFMGEIC